MYDFNGKHFPNLEQLGHYATTPQLVDSLLQLVESLAETSKAMRGYNTRSIPAEYWPETEGHSKHELMTYAWDYPEQLALLQYDLLHVASKEDLANTLHSVVQALLVLEGYRLHYWASTSGWRKFLLALRTSRAKKAKLVNPEFYGPSARNLYRLTAGRSLFSNLYAFVVPRSVPVTYARHLSVFKYWLRQRLAVE